LLKSFFLNVLPIDTYIFLRQKMPSQTIEFRIAEVTLDLEKLGYI
jgi:hypothetical protein